MIVCKILIIAILLILILGCVFTIISGDLSVPDTIVVFVLFAVALLLLILFLRLPEPEVVGCVVPLS